MKTSLLPNTDLANFAALVGEEKWRRLVGFKIGVPPLTYNVTRRYYADLLGLPAGPLTIGTVDIEKLTRKIWSECRKTKNDIEATSNVLVARGIREFAERLGISGRVANANELLPRSIGDRHIECWERFILDIGGRAVVPFFDLRRSGSQLTVLGRRVIFSLMHESIRTHPDYGDIGLAIVQFDDDEATVPSSADTKLRLARIVYADGVELFSYDDLKEMIRDTDRMWWAICAGRQFDARMYRTEDEDRSNAEVPPLVAFWRKEA